MLLAAGQSRRFSGIKQLAMINGQAMLARSIELYRQCQLDSFAVALGANAEVIGPKLPADTPIYYVEKWSAGMGETLSYMVSLAPLEATHILVGLGDQVDIGKDDVCQLMQMARSRPEMIIAAQYQQILGVPAIFPKAFFSALSQLSGDKGARSLLKDNKEKTVAIDLPAAGIDIDTQDDLKKWLESHRQRD